MRTLVVGGGGREHAIVRALGRSGAVSGLVCAPGNPGIAADAECVAIGAEDVKGLVGVARDREVDLCVVGPEAPLVAGLVDAMADAGVRAFGPSREAARLEGSKVFSKEVMKAAGIPTAPSLVVRTREEALEHAACQSYPAVYKSDGLAAGKGVIIAADEGEARAAIDTYFTEKRFGETEVLVETFLEGEELSLLALCDGENVLPLAPAQDYKRIRDNDEGPNTGGMGSYSPVPGIDPGRAAEIAEQVHRPVVDELRRRGSPYHGVLYAGLMLTADGPYTLEFNCRFGDPETQAVLPRLRSDLAELCVAACEPGGLADAGADFGDDWAVTVVLASAGYPESSSKGDVIKGVEDAAGIAEVTHAGTGQNGSGKLVTAGGRVLNVTGIGPTATEARKRAYEAAGKISFDGMQMRTDIAARAAAQRGGR